MIDILLLGLAVASQPPRPTHPAWMVGTWGWQNPGERGNDCGTDHDVTYTRNGRYEFMDEVGTWRIEGNRLIETMTDPGGTGDPAARYKSRTLRFIRVGKGVLRVTGPNGGIMTKCHR